MLEAWVETTQGRTTLVPRLGLKIDDFEEGLRRFADEFDKASADKRAELERRHMSERLRSITGSFVQILNNMNEKPDPAFDELRSFLDDWIEESLPRGTDPADRGAKILTTIEIMAKLSFAIVADNRLEHDARQIVRLMPYFLSMALLHALRYQILSAAEFAAINRPAVDHYGIQWFGKMIRTSIVNHPGLIEQGAGLLRKKCLAGEPGNVTPEEMLGAIRSHTASSFKEHLGRARVLADLGFVEAAYQDYQKLADARDLSSDQRNQIAADIRHFLSGLKSDDD